MNNILRCALPPKTCSNLMARTSRSRMASRTAALTDLNADGLEVETGASTQKMSPAQAGPNNARPMTKGKSITQTSPIQVIPRANSPWKVGAHVSAAGGVENAVLNAASIGANAFALFVKQHRRWDSAPLSANSIEKFRERLKEHSYDTKHVLPHGNYLVNLGNPDASKRQKSFDCFVDDLRRCELLGLKLYNFHPGSTVGETTAEGSIALIAESLNAAHKMINEVVTVIENMSGATNIIGSTFEQLGAIIALVDDKSRVGVCIDTCHAFAAGYDFRTKERWEKTIKTFDDVVGLKYLRGMHLNDSKTECGSKKDRHENIGLGHIGLSGFQHILTDPRMHDIPLILETPSFEEPAIWAKEIELLNRVSLGEVVSGEESGLEGVAVVRDLAGKFGGTAKAKKEESKAKLVKVKVKAVKETVKSTVGSSKRKGKKRKTSSDDDDADTASDVDEDEEWQDRKPMGTKKRKVLKRVE